MSSALELLGFLLLPTVATSLLTGWLLRRFAPASIAARYATAAPAAAAFAVGYVLLPDWALLWPQRHWQWLPYLAIAAAVVGPIGQAPAFQAWERALLHVLFGVVAGWLLVPTWETLEPSRATWMVCVAGGISGLTW